jgi:hypothetical protein
MDVRLLPDPGDDAVLDAVAAALAREGAGDDPGGTCYGSAWRRAGLTEAVDPEREPAGYVLPAASRPPLRSRRGAARA